MTSRLGVVWIGSVALILGLTLLGIAFGATPLPLGAVWHVLGGLVVPGWDAGVPDPVHRIVLDLRLPRVILAASVGAGLATVGLLLQTGHSQ